MDKQELSSTHRMRTSRRLGFTLVEIMIIAPIVILFIGAFIALVVNLTGESLRLREKNEATYNVQETLKNIRSEVALATSFQTTTGNLASPQGKNSSTLPFTNTTANEPDTLIMKATATTKSPIDPSRTPVYSGTGACDSKNAVYLYYIVYFVKDGSLFKRTILPQQAACATPWQRGSCEDSVVAANPTICKKSDEKLLDNVASLEIEYYADAASTSPLPDTSATSARNISVAITSTKDVAGQSISYSSTTRITSLNAATGDTTGNAPPAPQVTWTSASTTPYTTTFQWDTSGNATGYDIRYRIDGGLWINGPQNTTATSYDIVATNRKQTVEIEVTALTSAGNYVYGTASRTIPRWQSCTLLNGWQNYGNGYNDAGFTKTKSGIVGLRGLVRAGPLNQSICTLPVGFRPKFSGEKLIFQVPSYNAGVSGWGRVDVLATGEVVAVQGENPWVSLDGVMFAADTSSYSWTNGTWQNGWSNYGAGHATLRSTLDSEGRVLVQGLGTYPGTAGSTVMTNLGASKGSSGGTMHIGAMSNVRGAVNIDANGNIIGRGNATSYQQLQFIYYPPSFGGWSTMTFQNGWSNYGGGWPTLACYKGSDDIVTLKGLIRRTAGSGDGTYITDTPSAGCGTYTDGRLILAAWQAYEEIASVDLLNGSVWARRTGNVWTSLDGVHFIAD